MRWKILPLDGCFPNDFTISVKISIYYFMKFTELVDCHQKLRSNLLTLKITIRIFEVQKTRSNLKNTFVRGIETVNYKYFTVMECPI